MGISVVSGLLLGLLVVVSPAHATVITMHEPSPRAYDSYGFSIDSANGFLVVGQPLYNGENGEVFIYNALTGTLIRTLFSPNSQTGGSFGWSVEIAGNLLIVGAAQETVNGLDNAGRVYIFNITTGDLMTTLVSSNPEHLGGFGRSVSADDGLLAVGAPFETANGQQSGRVHVFDIQTGSEIMTLISPNPQGLANGLSGVFGAEIDLSGDHIIVGAPLEGNLAGHAYVFNAISGALLSRLASPNAPNELLFGSSVALTGQHAFVGSPDETVNGVEASGSVYDFNIHTGSLIKTIVDPNSTTTGSPFGFFGGSFGHSLALAGNSLIVGAPSDNVTAFTSGRVYVFCAATGSLTTALVSPDTGVTGSFGSFGSAVDWANQRIYVGAPSQDVNGLLWAGAVYIFAETGPGGSCSDSNQA